MPSSRGSSQPRSPTLQADSLWSELTSSILLQNSLATEGENKIAVITSETATQVHLASQERHEVPFSMAPSNQAL